MRKYFLVILLATAGIFIQLSCKKTVAAKNETSLLEQAKDYYRQLEAGNTNTRMVNAGIHEPNWNEAVVKEFSFGRAVVVPDSSHQQAYFSTLFGGSHVFPAKGNRNLLVYQDKDRQWKALWMHAYPDSNAYTAGRGFSGIRVAMTMDGIMEGAYRYDFNRTPVALQPGRDDYLQLRNTEICFSSYGYNYSPMDPENGYAWEQPIGCFTLAQDGTGGQGTGWQPYITAGDYGYAAGIETPGPDDIPYFDLLNMQVASGNNIIGNIADYNKCFNNIAGNGHQYAVTVCVAQPVPGKRDPWGFVATLPDESSDLVSGGHTFLILKESNANGEIIRNVGFYPRSSASPVSPIDQGQLNNDAEHEYNISLTIEMTNSQFALLVDFVNHGNDAGYNYNLNTNNCSSFVAKALLRAGFKIPFTVGTWINGGGFNPGDMGEDIRSMELRPGMSRSIDIVSHPNLGRCY